MHRAILLLAAWLAPALWACCPYDPDSLAAEAATMPGMLDLIAGRLKRLPPRHYEQQRAAALKAMEAEPGNFEHVRRAAEAWDMLGVPYEGVYLVLKLKDSQLSVTERVARDGLMTRLFLHHWLVEHDPSPGTAEQAQTYARTGPQHALLAMLVEWANKRPAIRDDEMLPDYFGLRYAGNKTAAADNDQLKTMGLAGVPKFLAELIELNPVWENVDTYYALSLALAVMGKQHLAQFARQRVHELLAAGKLSRLQDPGDKRDLRALIIPRHMKDNALVEIPTLPDDTRKNIAAEFASLRESARRWQAEREAFALKLMDAGKAPDVEANWQDFKFSAVAAAAAAVAPAANEPSAQAGSGGGMDTTVIVAAASSAVVVVVVMASIRRRRTGAAPRAQGREG